MRHRQVAAAPGFPTHKKLGKNIEYFIVNGAECEPLLRTDRYLMLHRAPDLVRAIMALKTELNIAHCVIALKHHYQAEAQALRQAIQAAGRRSRSTSWRASILLETSRPSSTRSPAGWFPRRAFPWPWGRW